MLKLIKDFVRDDAGLEMIEWVIVATLITTAATITIGALGIQVDATHQVILSNITP